MDQIEGLLLKHAAQQRGIARNLLTDKMEPRANAERQKQFCAVNPSRDVLTAGGEVVR